MSLADLIESSVIGTAKKAKDLQSKAKESISELKRVGEGIFGDNDQDQDNKLKSESDSDKENQSDSTEKDSTEKEKESGKLDKDPFSIEKMQYPREIQGLDDPDGPIKHWVTFYISEFESSKYASSKKDLVDESQRDAILGPGYTSTQMAQIKPPSASNFKEDIKGITGSLGKALKGDFKGALDDLSSAAQTGSARATAAGGAIGLGLGALGGKAISGAATGAFIGLTQNVISQRPKTSMLKKTINIYMPDTVMTRQQHSYENVSLTDMFGTVGALMQIGSPMMEGAFKGIYEGQDIGSTITSIAQGASAPGIAEVVGRVGETMGMDSKFKDALVRSQGFAINPQVELFFTGTERREFQFDFRFNSRSEDETNHIQAIIKAFRMHSAPSMPADDVKNGARYFVPPSQFDIKFFFRSDGQEKENPYLAKIGTCVLESVDVNYVGSGKFMTFEDGQPVDIEVRLSFREVDIMTREAIENGY